MARRPNIYDQLSIIADVERKHDGFLLTYTNGTTHRCKNSTQAREHALRYALETARMELEKHGKTPTYFSLDKLVTELKEMLGLDDETIQAGEEELESEMMNADPYDENNRIIQDALQGTDDEECVVFYAVDHKLTDIAAKGRVMFLQMKDARWTQNANAKDYQSAVYTDPTWLDVALAANAMIKTTTDYRHYFLEGIGEISETKDGVAVYGFIMGS